MTLRVHEPKVQLSNPYHDLYIHGTTKSPRPTPVIGYGKCFLFSHLYASGQAHLSTSPLTWDQALFSFRFLNKILALPP